MCYYQIVALLEEAINMKKNQPVEVTIKESMETIGDAQVEVHELMIGKNVIGKVAKDDQSKFKVSLYDNSTAIVKTFESGYEEVLRVWNLHN